MNKLLKGYSLHNGIDNSALQAWNRLQTANNIMQDIGNGAAECYLNKFTKEEQAKIAVVVQSIQVLGYERVNADIMKSVKVGE